MEDFSKSFKMKESISFLLFFFFLFSLNSQSILRCSNNTLISRNLSRWKNRFHFSFFFFFFLMIFHIYTIVIFDVKSSNLSSYSCFVYKFLGHRSGAIPLFFSKTILSAPILDYLRFHSRGLLNLPRSRYSRYSRTISEERQSIQRNRPHCFNLVYCSLIRFINQTTFCASLWT